METFLDRLKYIVAKCTPGKKPKPTVFAAKAGVPPGTFHKYYKEGAHPSVDHLIRISEYSHFSIDWLLTGKGTMYRDNIADMLKVVSIGENEANRYIVRSQEDKEAYSALQDILTSEDQETILAIRQSLKQFRILVKGPPSKERKRVKHREGRD